MPTEWTDAEFELLSAYIDEQLDDSERTALEARLADDAELRQELAAMRQTVALLHSLPTIQAPRAFTLTPEMIGQAAVPGLSIVPPSTPETKVRPLQPRRVWWIPAASAAGVVLLAGVILLSQTSMGNAPASSVALNPTLVAATSTAALEGSMLNTVIQDVVPPSTVAAPVQAPEIAATGLQVFQASEEASSTVFPTPAPTQIQAQEQAADNAVEDESGGEEAADVTNVELAPAIQPVLTQGVVLPQAADTDERQESAPIPRSQPSATIVTLDGIEQQELPPGQGAAPTLDLLNVSPANSSDTGAAYNLDVPPFQGGAGGSETAMTGIVGINPNPDAPGFSVATMSPIQVTEVAMYNAVNQPAIAAASVTTELPADTSAKRDPIWIRLFNSLADWFEMLFNGK